jgi:uncharacterized protein YmfQ (DUF2313 family)
MSAIAGLGAADFLSAEQNLLPPGDALTRDTQALLTTLLSALSGRMVEVHAQVGTLTEIEADPRQTNELLPDWESSFGLPDSCLGVAPTVTQRRAQLVARIAGQGGQDTAYFTTYAENLGFTITITLFKPFTFGMPFGLPMYGQGWIYVWEVHAAAYSAVLECELQRIAPAQALLIFSYP